MALKIEIAQFGFFVFITIEDGKETQSVYVYSSVKKTYFL